MKMSYESWWAMHEAMVAELQARNFELEDSMRNPNVFVAGAALDVVYEASDSPVSPPAAWKAAVVSRWRQNNVLAEARKRELFLGAQIGATFAKQYFEDNSELAMEAAA